MSSNRERQGRRQSPVTVWVTLLAGLMHTLLGGVSKVRARAVAVATALVVAVVPLASLPVGAALMNDVGPNLWGYVGNTDWEAGSNVYNNNTTPLWCSKDGQSGPYNAYANVVRVTGTVNVRSGPSTSYGVIGTAEKDDTYTYLGTASTGWYNISYGGTSAYISNKYSTRYVFRYAPPDTFFTKKKISSGSAYVPNSATFSGTQSHHTVVNGKTQQVAYILDMYHSAATSGNATDSAAAHIAMNALSVNGILTSQGKATTAVMTRKSEIASDAAKRAGPYVSNAALSTSDGGLTMTLGGIGVVARNGKGSVMSGYAYTAVITGNAVFTANNSKTLTGTTGATAKSAAMKATGTGSVSVTITYTGLPAVDFFVNEHPVVQDLFSRAKKSSLPKTTNTITANTAVTATATTEVTSKVVNLGQALSDKVTATASPAWPAGKTIRYHGDLYGPFTTPPAQSATVSGTRLTQVYKDFTAPGTLTGPSVTPTVPGFYTWRWVMDKDQAINSPHTAADWVDQFGEPIETSSVRHITTSDNNVNTGYVFTGDTITASNTLTGVPSGHGTFAAQAGFVADNTTVTHRLYGPFSTKPTSTTALSGYTGTVTTATTSPSSTLTFSGTNAAETPGWYVIVSTHGGDARISGFTTNKADTTAMVYVSRKPQVSTSADATAYPGVAFNDTATITDPDGYMAATTATYDWFVRFKAYGPAATPSCAVAPFFTGNVAVTGPGTVNGPNTTVATAGNVRWVAELVRTTVSTGAQTVIDAGLCGEAGETTSVTAVPNPTVTGSMIGLDANGDGRIQAGEQTRTTWTVRNNATVPITNVTLTAPGETISPASVASLAAGASTTFIGLHTVTTTEAAAGVRTSTGTATGTTVAGPVSGSGTASATVHKTPAVDVTVTVKNQGGTTLPGTVAAPANVNVSDTLTWTFNVRNTGASNLTGVTIANTLPVANLPAVNVTNGTVDGAPFTGTLAPGKTLIVSVTGSLTTVGSYTNTTTATGKPPVGTNVTDTYTWVANVSARPTLSTTAIPSAYPNENFTDTATITDPSGYMAGKAATHDWKVKFEAFGPVDPAAAPVCSAPFHTSYANVTGPGNVVSAATSVSSSGDVLWVASLIEVVTATGAETVLTKGACGDPSEITNVTALPPLTVVGTMVGVDTDSDGRVEEGEKTTTTWTVTNESDVTVTNVTLAAPGETVTPASVASLAPGASATFTGSHTVTAADAAAGKDTSTGTANGTTPFGPVTGTGTASVPVDLTPAVEFTVEKVTVTDADGATFDVTGGTAAAPVEVTVDDVISWEFNVTNTGATPLTDVTLANVGVRVEESGTVPFTVIPDVPASSGTVGGVPFDGTLEPGEVLLLTAVGTPPPAASLPEGSGSGTLFTPGDYENEVTVSATPPKGSDVVDVEVWYAKSGTLISGGEGAGFSWGLGDVFAMVAGWFSAAR